MASRAHQPFIIKEIEPGVEIEGALPDLEESDFIVSGRFLRRVFLHFGDARAVDGGRAADIDKRLDPDCAIWRSAAP
jgi:hypothetical protein